MSLLDELKQQKAEIAERLERACKDVQYFDGRMADLLLAISALEPAPVAEPNPDVAAFKERFPGFSSEPAPLSVDDLAEGEPVEFISDLTGDPAIEPESGLHGEPVPQPEWNEPVASSWIDQQTCEPIDPTLRAFQDDHIVEPEPTGGYAPVTNPDAEAQAKALDYYSPERVAERNRFNPFNIFKREDA